jgi:hypothetical protein
MDSYGATVYTNSTADPRWHLANLPTGFALRIDLDYPDGNKVVLIYDNLPSQSERAELMWKLQVAAGAAGFTITGTEANGFDFDAPPIGANRKGDR